MTNETFEALCRYYGFGDRRGLMRSTIEWREIHLCRVQARRS